MYQVRNNVHHSIHEVTSHCYTADNDKPLNKLQINDSSVLFLGWATAVP